MPDNEFGERALSHVAIDLFRDPGQYRFPNRPQTREPKRNDYHAHAETLLQQLNAALGAVPVPGGDERLAIAGLKPGTIVEVETLAPDGDRVKASKIPKIEFPGEDIVVLRSQRNDDRTESAVLFIPDEARGFIREKIQRYGEENLGNHARPDVDRFETIEAIRAAVMRTLFQGPVDFDDPAVRWWELWVRQPALRANSVAAAAQNAGLDVHADRLTFPDTIVLFVHATVAALIDVARRMPGAVSEVRLATGTIEPFLDLGGTLVQADFVAELAERVTPPEQGAPTVCVLDTGVSAAHPLIAPALAGAWTHNDQWGTDDHEPHGGHGTAMAGLVLYGDLERAMNDQGAVALAHTVESVKFLPPRAFPATDPANYGVVTQAAVARVELDRPDAVRTYCVATSSPDFSPARPSSWSGAIDQLCAGAMTGDRTDNVSAAQHPKRLLLIATGNAEPGQRDAVEPLKSLEDPAQSWNALTVGGYTAKEAIPEDPPGLLPLVPANNRSPYSRGSRDLPDDLTPIKPEVLFEAGNMLVDAAGYCGSHPAVCLLAAGSDVEGEPLIPFNATSAAAGVAGNFLGRLKAAVPGYWPETYRALAVNAADWPQPIRSKLIGNGAHWRSISKGRRQAILREVGFGVPNFDRAVLSAANDVTMIAQAEIQPYASINGQPPVFNEMHFYDLPWPRAILQELENATVTMKVTLSYFIEPNLSGRAATRPDTYRSFGLRFEMKKRTETAAAFKRRMTAQRAAEDAAAREASHWLLGPNAVQAGSLHCDLWRGAAVDLASHDAIAVYPVGGWWKSHVGQRRMNDKARYALVLSLSAPGQDVDLHADITAMVEAKALEIAAAQIEAAPGEN